MLMTSKVGSLGTALAGKDVDKQALPPERTFGSKAEVLSGARAPARRWRWLRPVLGVLKALFAKLVYGLSVWRTRAADQRGSQITDNLGLVVIGIVAIVAIGGLISGLDQAVFKWITSQLGLSGPTGSAA
jgi:hypothetical protein